MSVFTVCLRNVEYYFIFFFQAIFVAKNIQYLFLVDVIIKVLTETLEFEIVIFLELYINTNKHYYDKDTTKYNYKVC